MKFGFPIYTASDIKSSIEKARKLNFDYVELDLNSPRPEIITRNELKILKTLKDYNLEIAFHGPIFGIDISHFSEKISEASMEVILNDLEFSNSLNPLYFNLHLNFSSNPHLLKHENFRNEMYKKSIRNLKRIINSTSINLTLENNCRNPIFKTLKEFNMIRKLNIEFCFDVGHARVAKFLLESDDNNVDWEIKDWIKSFKDKILVTHLHDCIIKDNQISDHNLIGSGCINFNEVFEQLKHTKCKYALIEIGDRIEDRKIKESLELCRNGLK